MGADLELEWLVTIERAVEFLAFDAVFVKPAGVVHHASLARLRHGTGADFDVDNLHSGWCGHDGLRGGGCEGGGGDYGDDCSRNQGSRAQTSLHSLASLKAREISVDDSRKPFLAPLPPPNLCNRCGYARWRAGIR